MGNPVRARTDRVTDRRDIFRWCSVISQLPSITFREFAFQIGRGDAVTIKADELAGPTVAWHGVNIRLIRISRKGSLDYHPVHAWPDR